MPQTKYLEIKIADQDVEITDISDLPLSISYNLEDPDDFQRKKASQALSITIPATLQNSKIANDYTNPASEDTTPGQIYKSHQPAVIIAGGTELLQGKAFLINGTHNRNPLNYEFSFYGNNGDWIIDLKEKTLYDFLKHINFIFSVANIQASWVYDGTNPALPYVFAPVKYRDFMDFTAASDANVEPTYMRPAISPYFIIYQAFKSLGYQVQSAFLDSAFFRRQVMPWTWGNFLDSDGTALQVHKFLAMSANLSGYWFEDVNNRTINLQVTNDSTNGGFDNNNEYRFVTAGAEPNKPFMEWEYKAPNFGNLDATLSAQINFDCTLVGANSYCIYKIQWTRLRAGVRTIFKTQDIIRERGHNLGREDIVGIDTFFATTNVILGDKVEARLDLECISGKGIGARANCITSVMAFQLEYFRIPLGGTINFENYVGFKKYKVLDFLGGIADFYNLSITTNTQTKTVLIEPTHAHASTGALANKTGGYFNDTFIDWTAKKDLAEDWKIDLYSDYEKDVLFRFKDDSNDGLLKVLQDRHQNIIGAAKYVLPERFKAGKKEFFNRFFGACIHYRVPELKGITGIMPQLVALIPENISGTSNSEAANTFLPKLCYYKGNITGAGGWKFNGANSTSLPFMFAVNYNPGGENDPVLSYGDEAIDTAVLNVRVVAPGLFKRFFWQRFAIIRNGQFYDRALFTLNNRDMADPHHREFKIIDGTKWELVNVENYKPVKDESTACRLRKWAPVIEEDFIKTYPKKNALENPTTAPITAEDIKYAQRICLTSDIPK